MEVIMTLDKSAAAHALAEIDESGRRSSSLYSYRRAAPYFIVAGLMWLVADLLLEFSPFEKNWIWPVVSVVGTVAMILLTVFQTRPASAAVTAGKKGMFWRIVAVWLAIFVFMVATFTIYGVSNGRQSHSFIGVFCGCLYVALGAYMGWRMVAVGVLLAALSLFGFFEVHQYYLAYMGLVGGSALIGSGLWLRAV
jgi:hypothetical protein